MSGQALAHRAEQTVSRHTGDLAKLSIPELHELGKVLVSSGFLPKAINTPQKAVAIMLKGQELQVPPMQALSHIHVIEGKPTMSAELMVACVQRAGHKLRVIETSPERCTVEGLRFDDPRHRPRLTFTMAEAEAAGVARKQVWKQYPAAMLRARAISALCRFAFADVLAGVSYVPEELGAEVSVDEEGQVVEVEVEIEGEASEAEVEGSEIDADHQAVLEEVEELLKKFPEPLAEEEKIREYAGQDIDRARVMRQRLRRSLNQLQEPAGDGPITDAQYQYLTEILDELYADRSDVLDGHEWFQEARLAKPLAELTEAEAKQLIAEQDEEFRRRKNPDGSASEEDKAPVKDPDNIEGVEKGGAQRKAESGGQDGGQKQGQKGDLPVTKKQRKYMESLIEEYVEGGLDKFEEMMGKPLSEFTREEASTWIERFTKRSS